MSDYENVHEYLVPILVSNVKSLKYLERILGLCEESCRALIDFKNRNRGNSRIGAREQQRDERITRIDKRLMDIEQNNQNPSVSIIHVMNAQTNSWSDTMKQTKEKKFSRFWTQLQDKSFSWTWLQTLLMANFLQDSCMRK